VQENSGLRAQGEQAAADDAPPAPAATAAPAPTEDMPAPASSELSAPPSGAGFQTVPDNSQQPASSSSAQEVQP
jgi:hypothetical protein